MKKIIFRKTGGPGFFTSLNTAVQEEILTTPAYSKAIRLHRFKVVFYFALHIGAYLHLYYNRSYDMQELLLSYIFIGLSGMLLGFNVSHDACHGAFSKNRNINYLLYHLSFNLQGNSAFLWKIRHNSSHHVFPNVDGCDADIDNNPFLRLSPMHPMKKHHRYQHIYAPLVYCLYTLHWFLLKDLHYLKRERVGNIVNTGYPLKEIILFIFWKLAYVFVTIVLPVLCGYPLPAILLAFGVMHIVNSVFFIHLLISTHFCMETQFPAPKENGEMPMDYYHHQLATSMDYSPTSRTWNFLMGGFNAHAAHHLYPKLPHTLYPAISLLIERKTKEFGLPYNKLNWLQSIRSHYRFLKYMGRNKNWVVAGKVDCLNCTKSSTHCAAASLRTK